MTTPTYRSMLFVPGQRPGWVHKALAAGPDAIILDLEDAVLDSEKDAARATVRASIDEARGSGVDVWVRPNGVQTGRAGLDLEAVVCSDLAGLVLPKLRGRDDVLRFDTLAAHCEVRAGVAGGTVAFIASLETAEGMAACEAIATASPRVVSLIGATARDADTARALGYEFTEDGLETLYLRSRILLASRAAGHPVSLCGMWQDIHDIEGLRRFARHQRGLGYDGQLIIHPNHVEPVHEIYGPSPDEVEFYRGMVAAFEEAAAGGAASVDYRGQHIDTAHLRTARAIVASAERHSDSDSEGR